MDARAVLQWTRIHWTALAGLLLAFVVGYAAAFVWAPHALRITILWNYWLAAGIGFAVGMTEMIARYRDDPWATLRSLPGIFYFAINAIGSALAYRLIVALHVNLPSETLKVLLAGFGAMAFFRSGLFTVRIGGSDVAVGPNLVLQIFLQALDRSYDRDRATPRSEIVAQSMSGVSFQASHQALPSICFNLMQNVTDREKKELRDQIDLLAAIDDKEMSDESKSLNLGLAILNLVGEKTLDAALLALGSSVMNKDAREIDSTILLDLAKVQPAIVPNELPLTCNTIADRRTRMADPSSLSEDIQALKIPPEGQAMLTVFRVIQQYGEATVKRAIRSMHV